MIRPTPAKPLRRIPGLHRCYDPVASWEPQSSGKLEPDHHGADLGYVYNPAFAGSAELQALETIYDIVYAHARHIRGTEDRGLVIAETGTADGLSTAFIARALLDEWCESNDAAVWDESDPCDLGGVWTCDIADVKGNGRPCPWAPLWRSCGVFDLIVPCVGSSIDPETWRRNHLYVGLGCDDTDERLLDLAFIDSEHTEEQVLAEWALLGPEMRHGGIVLFHDIWLRDAPGVLRAAQIIADACGSELVPLENSSRGLGRIVLPVRS